MKLQYLGDSRDAFKWDLLHYLCAKSRPAFRELVFIPLLTPDIPGLREGNTPHAWFECRPHISRFVASLGEQPRTLDKVAEIGAAETECRFAVTVAGAGRFLGSGKHRADYWEGFDPKRFKNSVFFYDPDTGIETDTQHGTKWLRHAEIRSHLQQYTDDSISVVYQHRWQRRKWEYVFDYFKSRIDYSSSLIVVYEANLAFFVMAKHAEAEKRMSLAISDYAAENPIVRVKALR